MLFSKISTYPQSLPNNFNLNQNWGKTNIPLCRARIGLSVTQKWIFIDFCEKSSKFFDSQLIREIQRYWHFLYHFKVLKDTFNLIPHLLKSDKKIRNCIYLCNKYRFCWYRLWCKSNNQRTTKHRYKQIEIMNIKSILKWTTTFHSGSSQFGSKRVLLVKMKFQASIKGNFKGQCILSTND